MRYPQAYVLIDKQFELPSIKTLQTWCKSKSPVYIQGVSVAFPQFPRHFS